MSQAAFCGRALPRSSLATGWLFASVQLLAASCAGLAAAIGSVLGAAADGDSAPSFGSLLTNVPANALCVTRILPVPLDADAPAELSITTSCAATLCAATLLTSVTSAAPVA